MIISHKYKFIFLKTVKTAGTSIEISLSRYCGENDIITPISPVDEKIRAKFGKYPQNYKVDGKKISKHASARKIKDLVGEEIWNTYYKFCFDRNPWDKLISSYYYFVKNPKKVSFDKFLKEGGYNRAHNFHKYTTNNEPVVNYLGKYENLESDLKFICEQIGLPWDGWLPKAKGNFRKNKKHYSTHYNDQQKENVQKYFKKEIDLLGYKFQKPQTERE
ncbi:sulfotransferase family 2 domain-containing protein [Neobacillus drentensis]|uniref:sulfotransferase family 2 domain-containing protein n=1 Tax=Neobacillus drentensis TaxID=220684 RepID=UPI002FFDDB6C